MRDREIITSVHNPLVKQLHQLARSRQERYNQNKLILEGTHLLLEALQYGYPLEIVGADELWQKKHPDLWVRAHQQAQRLITFTPAIIAKIATSITPDGVIATAPLPEHNPEIKYFGLALWYIQDPGNLGTLIRTAVATGCEGLLLSDHCVDITNPKVIRASAGQWFRCAVQTSPNLGKTLAKYQQKGVQIVATSASAPVPYWEWDLRPPTIVLLGNEGSGLPGELLELADGVVQIPVLNGVESLNVAIAGALLCYEVLRQRQ